MLTWNARAVAARNAVDSSTLLDFVVNDPKFIASSLDTG